MIHASAIIADSAQIGDNVSIGPYSIIGDNVTIGEGTWIGPHVVIQGPCEIGRHNKIYQFNSLGEVPQDKKFQAGDRTWFKMGDNNVIREFCTFNRGTVQDRGMTQIGDHNWIMAYVHLAHDCTVGDHTIFANGASLAGHVTIGNRVVMGGFALVYQFVRIGDYAICGFSSGIKQDVLPYAMVNGMPANWVSINREAMKRADFSREEIKQVKMAFDIIYRSGLAFADARKQITALALHQRVLGLIAEFLNEDSRRGLIR